MSVPAGMIPCQNPKRCGVEMHYMGTVAAQNCVGAAAAATSAGAAALGSASVSSASSSPIRLPEITSISDAVRRIANGFNMYMRDRWFDDGNPRTLAGDRLKYVEQMYQENPQRWDELLDMGGLDGDDTYDLWEELEERGAYDGPTPPEVMQEMDEYQQSKRKHTEEVNQSIDRMLEDINNPQSQAPPSSSVVDIKPMPWESENPADYGWDPDVVDFAKSYNQTMAHSINDDESYRIDTNVMFALQQMKGSGALSKDRLKDSAHGMHREEAIYWHNRLQRDRRGFFSGHDPLS